MLYEHTNHGPDHRTLTDITDHTFMYIVENVRRDDEQTGRATIRERRLAQLAAMTSPATTLEQVVTLNGDAAPAAKFAKWDMPSGGSCSPAWAKPVDWATAWQRLHLARSYVRAAAYATAYAGLRSPTRRAFAREVVTRTVREVAMHAKWLADATREQDVAQFNALLALVAE